MKHQSVKGFKLIL